MEKNDLVPTLYSMETIGRTLSRAEIELVLTEHGVEQPTKNVLFYIVDKKGKMFLVRYFAVADKYGYEKLSEAK